MAELRIKMEGRVPDDLSDFDRYLYAVEVSPKVELPEDLERRRQVLFGGDLGPILLRTLMCVTSVSLSDVEAWERVGGMFTPK